MDTFKDYKVAEISDEVKNTIIQLEEKITNEKQKDIVLVAYEKQM